MTDGSSTFERMAARSAGLSERLNWFVERLCAVLAVVLILDVWLGVLVRYVIPVQLTFTEEAARYLMIWMALLAVSCGIARREHIGVLLLFDALPRGAQHWLLAALDVLGFCFFFFLFYYGVGFALSGATRFTMIYGMTKGLPFAAVPVSAALACVQFALVAVRDQAREKVEPGESQT